MKILELTVTKQWFDMILSGVKLEEYREIKKYWLQRLFKPIAPEYKTIPDFAVESSLRALDYGDIPGFCIIREFDAIRFTNGYGKSRPSFLIECKGINAGIGRKEWGAPEEKVFILKLGRILEKQNIKEAA